MRATRTMGFIAGCVLFGAAVSMPLEAQSFSLVQIPSVSVAAGIPSTQSQTVCTTALNTIGDGCPAASATVGSLQDVETDSYGNIYISDKTNSRVRVIYEGNPALAAAIMVSYNGVLSAVQSGYIYTLFGGGTTNFVGAAGAKGSSARLSIPHGLALDSDGNVFLDDNGSQICVFHVAGSKDLALLGNDGSPTTTVSPGYVYYVTYPNSTYGYNYDNSKAYSSSNAASPFDYSQGLLVDANENVYVADTSNSAIRKISASTGLLSTIAGGPGCKLGTAASCTAGDTGNGGK